MSIQIEGLTKRFGDRVAVDGLTLDVPGASIFGFLGPNGSGKTTTIRMLLGIVRPDAGRVTICGEPLDIRRHDLATKMLVGAVSENQHLYDDMTCREYLTLFADLYKAGRSRVEATLEGVGLMDRADDLAVTLSKGLQQKLGLARALIHDPPVLVLDEPVSGLDPHGVREFREMILRERDRGRCVFLSSHVLSEVERTADRVAILSQGRLVLEDETSRVAAMLDSDLLLEIELDRIDDLVIGALTDLPFVTEVARENGNRVHVRLKGDADNRLALAQALSRNQVAVLEMQERRSTLEEVFMTMTSGPAHVEEVASHG